MKNKLTKHITAKGKIRQLNYYMFISNAFDEKYHLEQTTLHEIYDEKCPSKIKDYILRLDFLSWPYFKPHNWALDHTEDMGCFDRY